MVSVRDSSFESSDMHSPVDEAPVRRASSSEGVRSLPEIVERVIQPIQVEPPPIVRKVIEQPVISVPPIVERATRQDVDEVNPIVQKGFYMEPIVLKAAEPESKGGLLDFFFPSSPKEPDTTEKVVEKSAGLLDFIFPSPPVRENVKETQVEKTPAPIVSEKVNETKSEQPMNVFKKIGKGIKKAAQGVSKVLSKVLPVAKLATGILPGGQFVDKVIDKAVKPLAKFGGAMNKVKKANALVGATGLNINTRQTVNPKVYKAAHPNKAIGALSMNHGMSSWRENVALASLPDDEDVSNVQNQEESKAGFGLWAGLLLLLIFLGGMFGKKRS